MTDTPAPTRPSWFPLATLIAGGLALVLTGAIVWAGFIERSSLMSEGAAILAMPWGLVTLLDLYVGFVLYAVLVFTFEPRRAVATAWVVPVFFLGNLVMAAWVIWRLPLIVRRLKPARV